MIRKLELNLKVIYTANRFLYNYKTVLISDQVLVADWLILLVFKDTVSSVSKVQTIPANLIAAGYIALREFFLAKGIPGSDGDPREDKSFIQGHVAKKSSQPKQPARKKLKPTVDQPQTANRDANSSRSLSGPSAASSGSVINIILDDDDEDDGGPTAVIVPAAVAVAEILFCLSKESFSYFRLVNDVFSLW